MTNFSDRFEVRGFDMNVYAVKPRDDIEGASFTITFNSIETFSQLVARLARNQYDAEVKKAVFALENEMGRRVK